MAFGLLINFVANNEIGIVVIRPNKNKMVKEINN